MKETTSTNHLFYFKFSKKRNEMNTSMSSINSIQLFGVVGSHNVVIQLINVTVD